MVNRRERVLLLALLTAFCVSPALAQPQPDTLAFAQRMALYRTGGGNQLTEADLKSIQTEYLAWLNTRVAAGRTIDQMNAELAAADLTDAGNRRNIRTGFVPKVQAGREKGPPDTLNLPDDLMTFVLGIYTGPACSFEDTLVLYSRSSRRRIGVINSGTVYQPGYHFGAVAAGPPGLDGARLIATDWIASGCFYTYRQVFRIDSLVRGQATQIHAQISPEARDYSTRILLDEDTVQFKFDTGKPTASEERYRVQGASALRIAPIGQSVSEFIWEWLRLNDSDAARFSSPDAAAQHHSVMRVGEHDGPGTLGEPECPGAPPIRELRGDWLDSKRFAYFRVSGTTPDTFRMEYVGDKTICDSVVLPPPQPDTATFAQHMARYRTPHRNLTAAEFKSIQAEYLAWLHAQVSAGRSIEQMNVELASAKLLFETDMSNFGDSHTGFVATIRSKPVIAPPEALKVTEDLMLFLLPIYTGPGCNEDETLVLYQRQTRRRVGWLNGETAYQHGLLLGAVTAQPPNPNGARLIATDWITSNCSSSWNGQIFRIDSLAGGKATQLLDHSPASAMAGSTKIQVDKDAVQFTYYSMDNVVHPNGPLPVERYRVQGTQALRIAPLAQTVEGFIDDWLAADDSSAARFSSPAAAAQHHKLMTVRREESYDLTEATECPGTPPIREIRAVSSESKQVTFFRISGATAATLRMEFTSVTPTPGCRPSSLDDIRRRLP